MVFGNQYPVFGKSCWLLVQLLLIAYLSLITEYRFLYSSAKISNSRLSLAKICAYVEMGLFLELAVGSRPELCALSPEPFIATLFPPNNKPCPLFVIFIPY